MSAAGELTVTADGVRILETPAGHFRMSYAHGMQSHSRESHTETARRWGTLPADLAPITDVVADPCWPDGERFRANPDAPNGQDERPAITVNRVTYSGTLYYVSRGYYIGADYAGDNGWCVSYPDDDNGARRPFGHYWDGSHVTYWHDERRKSVSLSDAATRKLAGYLSPTADAMLADGDALRDYWRRALESAADYGLSDARRALESVNAFLSLARGYGSDRSAVALADETDLLP